MVKWLKSLGFCFQSLRRHRRLTPARCQVSETTALGSKSIEVPKNSGGSLITVIALNGLGMSVLPLYFYLSGTELYTQITAEPLQSPVCLKQQEREQHPTDAPTFQHTAGVRGQTAV